MALWRVIMAVGAFLTGCGEMDLLGVFSEPESPPPPADAGAQSYAYVDAPMPRLYCHADPCGGDPTGTWTAVAYCPEAPEGAECAAVAADASLLHRRLEFAEDRTTRLLSSGVVTVRQVFAPACVAALNDGDPVGGCAAVSGHVSGTCEADDACICHETRAFAAEATGRYVTVGTKLTRYQGETAISQDYCVLRDWLWIAEPDGVFLYRRED